MKNRYPGTTRKYADCYQLILMTTNNVHYQPNSHQFLMWGRWNTMDSFPFIIDC